MLLLHVCAACLASLPGAVLPASPSFGTAVDDGVLARVLSSATPTASYAIAPGALRPVALATTEQMDVWWANDGLALIAASRDLARGAAGVAPLLGVAIGDGGLAIDRHLLDRTR